jgi:hypothetical protein
MKEIYKKRNLELVDALFKNSGNEARNKWYDTGGKMCVMAVASNVKNSSPISSEEYFGWKSSTGTILMKMNDEWLYSHSVIASEILIDMERNDPEFFIKEE